MASLHRIGVGYDQWVEKFKAFFAFAFLQGVGCVGGGIFAAAPVMLVCDLLSVSKNYGDLFTWLAAIIGGVAYGAHIFPDAAKVGLEALGYRIVHAPTHAGE